MASAVFQHVSLRFSCRKISRRKFRSQTSNVWPDATVVRTAREERVSNLEGRSEKRKKKKKEDQSVRKGRKVVKHCVFPMSCGARSSGGCGAIWLDERSKFARGCGAKRVSNPKCQKHPDAQSTFGDAHFEVERCKAPQLRTAFRS